MIAHDRNYIFNSCLGSILIVLLFCASTARPDQPKKKPNSKPNVLFIAVDDLGCYGNLVVKTPNIDRLADRHFRDEIPDAVTLPQAFQKAGYFAARVGKIYHYYVPASIGTDGMITTEAIRIMRKQKDQPFFLGVGFFRPHTPYVAPKKYFDMYPVETLRLPWAPDGDRKDIPVAAFAHNCPVPNYGLDKPTLLKATQAYYACVSLSMLRLAGC